MEGDKRLDLEAPLLSVRRRFSIKKPPLPRRSPLPFYKPELSSSPASAQGVVPFTWEQTPGQPKKTIGANRAPVPKTPPGRTVNKKEMNAVASGSSDEEEEYIDSGQSRSKPCRVMLIPWFWSKMPNCFLNGMTRMKIPSHPDPHSKPPVKTLHDHAANKNSWERYRLGSQDLSKWEDRSRLKSESNRFSYWSDSQTHEGGSSSLRNSDTATTRLTDFTDDELDGWRTNQGRLIEFCEADAMAPKLSQIVDVNLQCETMNRDDINIDDNSLCLKDEDMKRSDATLLPSILPPPLPQSPSESWLSQAVLSKNKHPPQSLLAIQFQPKSQSFRYSSVNRFEMNTRSLRFAEVGAHLTPLYFLRRK